MKINGILESSLYADDLVKAEKFYQGILGLVLFQRSENRHLFFRCGNSMLLIFNAQETLNVETRVGGNKIPFHGAEGAGHVAFTVDRLEMADWRRKLSDSHIEIESEVEWPNGGQSLYFRDPAANSLELTVSAIWGL